MIKFDVLNRFSGQAQFTAEIDCSEDERHAIKLRLAVQWAIANGASLKGTNLTGADLSRLNLSRLDLCGANLNRTNLYMSSLNRTNLYMASLYGASLYGTNGLNDHIKCIQVDTYPIAYTSDVLQIGCERHLIEDWRGFDDARIAEMDGKSALRFWRKYKDWIFQTIELCPATPTKAAEGNQ